MGAIPTTYRGIRFRSRIEARWAAMFDQLQWPWEYEPLDLDGYIPDFVLGFHRPLLVEVKSELEGLALVQHEPKIENSGWDKEAIIVGAAPTLGSKNILGSLWELCDEHGGRGWDDAVWIECFRCGTSLNSYSGSYECRRCGAHDGDGHFMALGATELQPYWAAASNLTAWKAAA
jgi:hypothetical protein